MKDGFIKAASASPVIKVADTEYNAQRVIETIKAAKGSVNTPSKEFHDYMVEAGKRSWKLPAACL